MSVTEKKIEIFDDKYDDSVIRMPAVALRGIVVFPHDVMHFDVGRKISINAMNAAMNKNRTVFLVPQTDIAVEEPTGKDVYKVGVIARIRQVLKISDDGIRVLVEGITRAKLYNFEVEKSTSYATVTPLKDKVSRAKSAYKEVLVRRVHEGFEKLSSFMPKMPKDIKNTVMSANDPAFLADYIAASIPVPVDDKQYVLEQLNPVKRLEVVLDIIKRELEICEIDAVISEKTHRNIEENQRDYYLREQMKVISGELYGDDDPDTELRDYYEKIEKSAADEKVKDLLKGEVNKLSKMPPGSHEATVIRVYLDTCLDLPFGVKTNINTDVLKAEKILEKDHYGLKKVKEQILETISVFALKPDTKGHIICLAGPPGVGKTSIAKSLASSMGRNFERVSLGGIHDEAEIRGHRKTYIGAMPGKIIKAITAAGSQNPLILLDEIDKLGSDYKGDPASALLEVLDSEQNNTFVDHYIDFPFDLSNVFFVTTANNVQNIPAPLLDRMDIIELPGYTAEDKFQIAKRHLIKKQMLAHGLTAATLKIDDTVIGDLISYYTREAGVRRLEREIAKLCRKAARKLAEGETKVKITSKNLTEFLGKHKYTAESILPNSEVGIINGLAWTAVGGEIMQLEVVANEGTGKVELTGSLGDVMKESALAAVSWVRSNAHSYNIDPDFYKNKDIHIHATEAAVPKDGPSAGVTITTALVSALSGLPIKNTVAMTGEVTIRGRVLPIGGLNEKTMAAYRAGVKTVIMPKLNEPDLQEIDPKVRDALDFVLVSNVSEVLDAALVQLPKKEKTTDLPPVYGRKSTLPAKARP
ncbi:MAG: endopeptidase La [Clostridia bacterium]|nr:endopeptidase La [Clostridia bacterium]